MRRLPVSAARPTALPTRHTALGALSLQPGAALAGAPGRRWVWGGLVLGATLTLLSQLPAAWLASALASATQGRLQLAETEGTVWRGSALPVLTGGPGSLDARVLPSRLSWQLSPMWLGLRLRLSQPCCMAGGATLQWQPGWRRMQLSLQAGQGETLGQWPAAWLEGLGAPFNTLRLGGQLRLASPGLTLRQQAGDWQVEGRAELELLQTSSRLAPVDPLGSYRLSLSGQPGQAPTLTLQTLDGALQLQGQGELKPRGLHFRAEAKAAPGQEPALNNLLNIIGRRQGASSVISIG